MAIELHLISFSIIMPLIHNSCVVNHSRFPTPSIFNEKRRGIRPFLEFFNILIQFSNKFLIKLVQEVYLIINDNMESLRVCGLINKWHYCVNELTISVRGNADEDLPIFRNWKWLYWLVYDLVKVNCEGVVIPFKWRHHLVQHFFALEQDSTT